MSNELKNTDIRVIDRDTVTIDFGGYRSYIVYGFSGNELFRSVGIDFQQDEKAARAYIESLQRVDAMRFDTTEVYGVGPNMNWTVTSSPKVSEGLCRVYRAVQFGPKLKEILPNV